MAGTTYYYRIISKSLAGDSEPSNIASAKTLAATSSARVLTLNSTTPVSGAYIYLTTDKTGLGDATTPASRSYDTNKVVTLVASATAGTNTFQKWQRDGVDFSVTATAYVTMDTDHTLTAVYGPSTAVRTLASLEINGAASLNENSTQTYTATARFSDGSTLAVSPRWSLSQNGAPATISTNGVLDAGAVVANTLAFVNASYTLAGVTVNATREVTIVDASSSSVRTLTLSISGQGHIGRSPNQNQFQPGAQVLLTAVPATNYRFTGWGGAASSEGTTNPITVTMDGDKTISASFVFQENYFAPVQVTIEPAGAAAAGALWRLDNGPWQGSGTTVIPSSNGSHSLHFSEISGYKAPAVKPIQLVSGEPQHHTVTYESLLPPGALQITLQPEAAVAAGAQWRPLGGSYPWQNSGGTLTGLARGSYQIEFATVAGWSPPATTTVAVTDGITSVATANYLPPAGVPILFSLVPSSGPVDGGTQVAIEGANFTAPVAVYFDGVASPSVTVVSSTQLVATTPPRATGGTVAVKVASGAAEVIKDSGFTYGPALGKNIQFELALGGSVTAVDVLDTRAYIGQGATLVALDVANPASPAPIGRLSLPYAINDIAVYRAADAKIYAVIAGNDGGLFVVDATNPVAMLLKGSLKTGGEARDVALLGGVAYVAAGYGGIETIALSDPARPQLLGALRNIGYCSNLLVEATAQGVMAYTADPAGNRIHLVDVGDPAAPVEKGAFIHGYPWFSSNYGFAKKNNLLYATFSPATILVIDVANPANPTLVDNLQNFAAYGAAAMVQGNYLYSVRDQVGVDIFDISSPASPSRIFNYFPGSIAGWTARAVLRGSYLFIAGTESGLSILNVATPSAPSVTGVYRQGSESVQSVLASATQPALYAGNLNRGVNIYSLGSLATASWLTKFETGDGGIRGMTQSGNLLFAAGGSNGMYVVDVASPSQPIVRSRFTPPQTFGTIGLIAGKPVVAGYAADFSGNSRLWTVDVGNPASPTTYGSTSAPGGVQGVVTHGNYAYVSGGPDSGLRVFNLGDPRNPTAIGNLDTPGQALNVAVSADGGTVYIAEGWASGDSPGGVVVANVSNPQNPTAVRTLLSGEYILSVTVSGARLIVARGGKGISVFDLQDPRNPVEIASFNTPGSALEASMVGDRIYVADGYQGVTVLTMTDAIAPVVTITNPTFNATYTAAGASVALGGAASDEKGVVRVLWSNDRGGSGEATGTDNWSTAAIPLSAGANVIHISAFDAAGNIGRDMLTVNYAPLDTTAPVIGLSYPTTAPTLAVTVPTLELRGTAADNLSVAQVGWSNARGGSGAATGTTAWTAAGISLQEGPNLITLTASDSAGNTVTTTLTVTYLPPDALAPAVTISFPTANASYQVLDPQLNISGTTSDDRGVRTVRWRNDRTNASGVASGATIWSANGLALQPGLNVITVTAEDEAGNSSTDTVAVTFLPPTAPVFVAPPASQTITAGQPATFTVEATGTPAPNYRWERSTDGGATWSSLDNDGVYSGTALASLTINGVTSTMDGSKFRAVATNGLAPEAASASATLTVVMPAVIVDHPRAQTATPGATVTFTVSAAGNGPLTYQWRKAGVALEAATLATLTLSNVQIPHSGSYDVVVKNGVSLGTSSDPARLDVVPPEISALHAATWSTLRPTGGTAVVANEFRSAGTITNLRWSVILPAGWSFVSSDATGTSSAPSAGTTSLLEWTWTTAPASPMKFTYTLNAPMGAAQLQPLATLVEFTYQSTSIHVAAKPDPLIFRFTHSADTDGDFHLNLRELTRIIDLYATRHGTERTGRYMVQSGTEDGFAPNPAAPSDTPGVLSRYHSADTKGQTTDSPSDGAIDLIELTRMIELYNYRSNTLRTGEYHIAPGTSDGAAPGP